MKNNPNTKRASGHNGAQAQGNQRNTQAPSDYRQDNRNYNHINRQTNPPLQVSPQIPPVNMAPAAVPPNISNINAISTGPQANSLVHQQFITPTAPNPSNIVPGVQQLSPHIVSGQNQIQLLRPQQFPPPFPPQGARIQFQRTISNYNQATRSQIPSSLMSNGPLPGSPFPPFFPHVFQPFPQGPQYYSQTMSYFPDMGSMRSHSYQTSIQLSQPQAPRDTTYHKRTRNPATVYNEDGSVFNFDQTQRNQNLPSSEKDNNKSTSSDSSGNKEIEIKPQENVILNQEQSKTSTSNEKTSVEDVNDAGFVSTPPSADTQTGDATMTLGNVDTKCDKVETADADKDAVDALADKLNSTDLNDEKELFVYNASDVPSPDAKIAEAETDDKSINQSAVELPKREMTPSDQSEKSLLEPEEQVKESHVSVADLNVGDVDAKPRQTRTYNREELMEMMSLAEAHPLPDNFSLDVSKKNPSPAEVLLPKYANARSGSGNEYRRTPMNAGRRNPQSNKFQERNRKSSNVPMSGDMAVALYTPSADAWKPDSLGKSGVSLNSDESNTEKLLKDVRSILNKLTPQNYDDLLKQFKALKIDSKDRLRRVIDRIFEKAVIEPTFVTQYAGFCSALVSITVDDPEKKDGKVSFKNLLIKKCEETFNEKMYSDIENYEERLKEIEECEDPGKKKELEEILDDEKRYSRKRSVGNIKLIAELYKINMLNTKIMCGCFTKLLQTNHEDYIECLCTLITNIGQTYTTQIKADPRTSENNSKHLKYVFEQLHQIHLDEHATISVSSRVKFMILDLIDLRNDLWVPRRKTYGPKKLAQVHQDLENEERKKKAEIEEMRKNKRISTTSGPPTDGWQNVAPKKKVPSNRMPMMFSGLTNKASLNSKATYETFKHFAAGSHGGANSNSQSRSSSSNFENQNKFSQLGDTTKAYHESMNNKPDRRDERKTSDLTGYQTRSDSGTYSERQDSTQSNGLSDEQLAIKCKNLIDSFLHESEHTEEDMNDTMNSLKEYCSPNSFKVFVKTIMTSAANSRDIQRPLVGKLFGYILQNFPYNSSEVDVGLKQFFETEMDDDLPNFWQFAGFTLAHALVEIKIDHKFKSNEIFKQIGDTLSNVTGSKSVKLTDALIGEIRKLGYEDKMKQHLQNSHIIQISDLDPLQLGNNDAKDFVHSYFNNKNSDPKALLSQFKFENCDEKTKNDAISSAIVYHLVNNQKALDKFKNDFIKLISIVPTDSIINQTFKVEMKMNHPPGLLINLFNFYLDSKLITEKDLSSYKNASSVQLSQLERFSRPTKSQLLK